MKPDAARSALWSALAVLALAGPLAVAMSPPAGWTRSQDGAAEAFVPGDLAAGESFTIVVHPATTLRGQSVKAWLDSWAADQVPGTAAARPVAEPGNEGRSATAQASFRDAAGKTWVAMFIAVSLDGDRVRALRIVATPSPGLFARQKPSLGRFIEGLAEDEAAAYRAGQRGAPLAPAPGPAQGYVEQQAQDVRAAMARAGVPKGSRAGGPFRYGTYEFEQPLPAINEVRRYRISFYENGEWRRGSGSAEDTSQFTYDPATGAANISVTLKLHNSRYDDADFCRFYVAPDGSAYLYAEDEYGLGTFRITGRHVGPNDRPSPEAETVARAAAQAEEKRFKWITPPGRGVAPEQVAGVLHGMRQVYGIGGLQLQESTYLLLRDGSAYEDLRCPPDQLDVLASRKREPLNWGRWRKSGDRYELQFPKADGAPGAWSVPSLSSIVRPAARGERLAGRYEKGSSFDIPGGAGSVMFRGVTFTPEGRFETDFRSITGGTSGFGADRVTTGVVADDDGASSSVSGPNFGGGSTTRSKRPKSARLGRYELDGYALRLQFDDGTVERLPFFFSGPGREGIWFRDAVYSVPRD
jgi:hypothetical protein